MSSIQIRCNTANFIRPFFIRPLAKIGALTVLGGSLLLTTSCSEESHAPLPGEYGEKLIASVDVPSDVIAYLNNTAMPTPNNFLKSPDIEVLYEADVDKNPYQFVIVSKGKAIEDGKVKLIWETGNRRAQQNSYHPAILSDDDTTKYKAGDAVLSVIASKPFEVAAALSNIGQFKTSINLTRRENFEFTNLELQVWEGEGSKKDWSDLLVPFALFLSLLIMAYAVYTKVTDRVR